MNVNRYLTILPLQYLKNKTSVNLGIMQNLKITDHSKLLRTDVPKSENLVKGSLFSLDGSKLAICTIKSPNPKEIKDMDSYFHNFTGNPYENFMEKTGHAVNYININQSKKPLTLTEKAKRLGLTLGTKED